MYFLFILILTLTDIEARNKIVCAYALFVVSNVNRWFSKYGDQTKLDLIQVGNEELIKLINTYDSKKGSFYNYASISIKNTMIKYLNYNHNVLTPLTISQRLAIYLHKLLKLMAKPGFDINDTEYLCQELK